MAKVEIYTRDWCGYCARAMRLLGERGAAFTEYNVGDDRAALETMQARAPGRTSVPQIFIGGQHIGGCDELFALDGAGKLEPLLAS
jgi:glutaredoxin 3